jgi:glycine betaine transporter
MLKSIKHSVFWPPFVLLMVGVIYSFIDGDGFLKVTGGLNSMILENFGWLFCWTSAAMLLICIAAFISPLGKVKIGGDDAEPLLTWWKWFSITLCTTIATGILFWGTAEPLYHLMSPPAFAHASPGSAEAASFALSTMFLHWAFTPYAIYAVPTLVFALVFYNRKGEYSLGSMVQPAFNRKLSPKVNSLIDAVCLYSLVAGMAASLGAGMLTLAGGAERLFGIQNSPALLAVIGAAIVITFAASSISGLMKGIRILSDLNAKIFLGMCLFVFIAGPTWYIIQQAGDSMFSFIVEVFPRTMGFGASEDIKWLNGWTIFYWAVWMAWAPVTALFLGRISYGYSVRALLFMNLLLPSLFSIVWMSVFSGASMFYQMEGTVDLYEMLNKGGVQTVIYGIFDQLPASTFMAYLFVGVTFLSFVTAADSNTSAMGGISSKGITVDSQESPMMIKILWGASVGVVSWVMVSFRGIEGIKMSSNLGGVPALLLLIVVSVSLVRLILESYSNKSDE